MVGRPWPPAGIDLTGAPHRAYLAALARATERCATLPLDAGTSSAGLPGPRAVVVDRYTRAGLPIRPDQILITSGATAALHLLADHPHDRHRPALVPAAAAATTRRAALAGLLLSPGPNFAADRTLTHYLRLPFTVTTDVLDHVMAVLDESLV